jgi:hypothetical protein
MNRVELARAMLPHLGTVDPMRWTPEHDWVLIHSIAHGDWGDTLARRVAQVRPGVSFIACRERFFVLRRKAGMPEPRRAAA